MALRCSVEKIIESYFSSVTWESFSFKKKTHHPKLLRVSPSIFFKAMTCVPGCGGCCPRFSLDYLPSEKVKITRNLDLVKRSIEFNERRVEIWSDCQEDNPDYYCRHLQREDSRCGVHQSHPFSCDFELLRFTCFETDSLFGLRPYNRAFRMLKTDGTRGAACEWRDCEYSADQKQDVLRKLNRLRQWTDHFGLVETALPTMIDLVEKGPFYEVLTITPPSLRKKGLF